MVLYICQPCCEKQFFGFPKNPNFNGRPVILFEEVVGRYLSNKRPPGLLHSQALEGEIDRKKVIQQTPSR